MNVLILGAGLMGRAAAWDMVRSNGVQHVRIADNSAQMLEQAKAFAGDVEILRIDAGNGDDLGKALQGVDVAVSCVPYRYNVAIAQACITAGAHMVDLGGNNDVVDAQYALSDQASSAGVTIIPDCGLAPGMAAVWAMAGADLLDDCHYIAIRCGGLPVHPQPPLNYMRLFSAGGLINEYIEPCRILVDGEEEIVPGMSGLERLSFPEPYDDMEAFYTSGGTSTLVKTLRGRVPNIEYKTVRYPGHIQHFQVMHSLGLTSSEPLEMEDGRQVVPRRMLEAALTRNLPSRGPDVTLLRVDCIGELEDTPTLVRNQLIDVADEQQGLSSMMRCTALPATAIARMLVDGTITIRGTQPQELAVPPETLRSQLAERGVMVKQDVFEGEFIEDDDVGQ